jgi:hypothetical protein
MTTLEQAEQLRQQAIDLLLAERTLIENKLAALSYDGAGAFEAKIRKPKTCGRCGLEGHTARKCPSPENPPA